MLFHKRNRRKRQATKVHRLLLQVLQLEDRCLPSVVLGTHYGGVSFASSGCAFCEPPNANAAAGPNHVVEILDPGFIQINDKAGNLISTEKLATFFAPLTPASQMDPFVLFDDSIVNSSGPNGRFIVGVLDFTSRSAPDSLDFAVSDSADPTGPFTEMHKISVGEGSFFADFPREGFNADAYVISFNMLNTSTGSFDHAQELTIQKSSVIDKNNATLTTFHADTGSGGTGHSTLAPALMHGSTTGDPMWFVTEGLSANQVDVIKMTNVLSNTPTFQDNNFSVTAYSHPPLPRQPGGTINNTQFSTGILNAVMRNNVLVADHNVGTGGGDHARWYQFTISGGTPSLTQSGDVNPGANIDTYYPAIEIDANGKLGMTFLQSSSSEFMSMYVTGRAASDASGTMETEQSVIEGVAKYAFKRLGAYSGITVDPATGTSFWAANEYATSDLWWGTEVANFSVVVTTFSATLVGNTLQITDNSGGVTALIRLKAGDPTTLEVLNNGSVAASFSFSSINNITVSLTGGNNQLTIDASNGDPVPSGGLSYDGGPTNTLAVNYAADTGSRTITLDTTTPLGDTPFGTIAGEAAGVISYEYADTSSATLTTGTGSDTLTVISTGTAVSLTDSAAATINIGNGNLNSLSGAVTVNGSGGATQVNVNDQSNSTVSTYTITATSVSRTGFAGLTYSHLAGLTLNGGGAGDTYKIQGTASGTTTTANGGAASSTFTVGSATNSLDPILGPLTINAGAGTANKLNVNDQGSTAALTYTVTATTLARTGSGLITFHAIATTTVNGGSGGNSFIVALPVPTKSVTLNGGSGTNTLTGPNATNTWSISSTNGGTLDSKIKFTKMQNLVGGNVLDTFKFSTAGQVSNITGGPPSRGDWLDYSSFSSTHPVNVNLSTGKASQVSGSISGIENVIGGAGADALTGDNNGNILIEHGGAGTINGGTGRSLFITGTGAVTVNGGSGGDLFIGGKTSYDTSSTGHLDLMYILAEWKSADPYTTRTDEITDGAIPGHTGVKLAVGSTVTLNPSTTAEHLNALASLTDLDWFFASSTSQYSTPETGELVNNDPN